MTGWVIDFYADVDMLDNHVTTPQRTPNARYVEFFRDDQVLNFRRLIDRQLEHRNGHVLLHQTPGLGFNFDEKMIKRCGNWLEIR